MIRDADEYDATPLTVGRLRELLDGYPDDMPVWTAYDGRWDGGPAAVGAVSVAGPGGITNTRSGSSDRPVVVIDA